MEAAVMVYTRWPALADAIRRAGHEPVIEVPCAECQHIQFYGGTTDHCALKDGPTTAGTPACSNYQERQ